MNLLLIGNILDHADVAMFSLWIPFLKDYFFTSQDDVLTYIIMYGIHSGSQIIRPFAASFWGSLCPSIGLNYTILGMSITTALFAALPSYDSTGIISLVLLFIVRSAQTFFATGENQYASYMCLKSNRIHNRISASLFETSTMLGIIIAPLSITISTLFACDKILFWKFTQITMGTLTFVVFLLRRKYISNFDTKTKPRISTKDIIATLFQNKSTCISLIFISGLSYATYAIPCIFLPAFISHIGITNIETASSINTVLMILDIVLMNTLAVILRKYSATKIIIYSLLSLTFLTTIFWFFESFFGFMLMRISFIAFGVAILSPMRVFISEIICERDLYLITGVSNSIGTSIIGRNFTPLAWIFFNNFGYFSVYFFIVFIISSGLFSFIFLDLKKNKINK
jgi:MFS family permease